MNTNRKQQVDFSGNQDKPNAKISKEPDSDSSKNNSAPGLFTLDKTPKLNFRASLSPPTELLSTLVKKKPHYIIVLTEEAGPKKKINDNIGEQNIVTGKRIKK